MPSAALTELLIATEEINFLQAANPSPTGVAPHAPTTTRAIGRASVVLLSSHFERYHRGLFEEISDWVNASAISSSQIPEGLRLRHSRAPIDELAGTSWTRRGPQLASFASSEASLWIPTAIVSTLEGRRLLEFMSAPYPEQLVKAYALLEINDVFSAVTRRPHTRSHFWLQLHSLVDKRNNIAHGDATVEATQADVRQFQSAVRTFCERVDRLISRHLHAKFRIACGWY
jgi:RiboL-PSP-HEPN